MKVWSTIALSAALVTIVDSSVWAQTEDDASMSGTISEMNDVQIMSLRELQTYAATHAPASIVAQRSVDVSEAAVAGATPILPANPTLEFEGGSRFLAGARGFEYGLSLTQELEVGGERGRRRNAARQSVVAAEARVTQTDWEVQLEVKRLYFASLVARQALLLAERFVEFSQMMQAVAAREVEAGEEAPLVLLIAQADTTQSEEAVIRALQLERALSAQLAARIGWQGDKRLVVRGELPESDELPAHEELHQWMLEQHPAILRVDAALGAALARVALEEREAWPHPRVGVRYGTEANPGGGADARVWSAQIALPLPLWRRNQQQVSAARGELAVIQAERLHMLTELRGELQEAFAALQAARQRVQLYRSGVVPRLEEVLLLVQRSYELGEADVYEVSQTRERLFEAARGRLSALSSYYEAVVDLERAVGVELITAEDVDER